MSVMIVLVGDGAPGAFITSTELENASISCKYDARLIYHSFDESFEQFTLHPGDLSNTLGC